VSHSSGYEVTNNRSPGIIMMVETRNAYWIFGRGNSWGNSHLEDL